MLAKASRQRAWHAILVYMSALHIKDRPVDAAADRELTQQQDGKLVLLFSMELLQQCTEAALRLSLQ